MAVATSIVCPGCSFEQDEGADTCARCGLIFARAHALQPPEVAGIPGAVVTVAPEAPAEPAARAWKIAGGGLLAALIAHALPILALILSPLVTLLHEFGHAVAAWLLGCPAIPAFDFAYGGGVTHHKNFQLPLGVLIGAGWLWLGWTFRRNPRTRVAVAACAGLWLIAVSADWRREVTIAALGHGGELILAAILLYMALSGRGWRIPEVERPLGAFAAFFVQFQTMGFAWRLLNDNDYLAWYRGGKGGALMNDLEVVALDIKIWTGLELDIPQVAGGLLACSFVPPLLAVTLYVFRDRVQEITRSLLLLDPP